MRYANDNALALAFQGSPRTTAIVMLAVSPCVIGIRIEAEQQDRWRMLRRR
jgi:hypothetical protein